MTEIFFFSVFGFHIPDSLSQRVIALAGVHIRTKQDFIITIEGKNVIKQIVLFKDIFFTKLCRYSFEVLSEVLLYP